jgi:transposase
LSRLAPLEPTDLPVIRYALHRSRGSIWTEDNRARYDRRHLRYESDLTDAEWAEVEPLIPPAKPGWQQTLGQYSRGGERGDVHPKHRLPMACPAKRPPPKSTVHDYLERWRCDGTLERMHHALYVKCREQALREASPTARRSMPRT